MKRRTFIAVTSSLACGSVFADLHGTRPAGGDPTVLPSMNGGTNSTALRDFLTKNLRASSEEQKTYINKVVSRVAQKVLPLSLVYASFRSARRKRPDYPFPLFKQTLNRLARGKNITI